MPTRPILVRVAVAVVPMAVFVALADGVAHHELRQTIGSTPLLPATIVVRTAGVAE